MRSTRYEIHVRLARPGCDESSEMAQANSRRVDAVKRAGVISKTWPSAVAVRVLDTRTATYIHTWTKDSA